MREGWGKASQTHDLARAATPNTITGVAFGKKIKVGAAGQTVGRPLLRFAMKSLNQMTPEVHLNR